MDQKLPQGLVMISQVTQKDMRRGQKVDLMMIKGLWQGMLALQVVGCETNSVANAVRLVSFLRLAAGQRNPSGLQIGISLLADMEQRCSACQDEHWAVE